MRRGETTGSRRCAGCSRCRGRAFTPGSAARRATGRSNDAWLTREIGRVHAASRGLYGSPRIHAELASEGVRVGPKRVERLMRQAGIEGAHMRRRRPGTTIRVAGVVPAEDLVCRDFTPAAANLLWVADLKQVETDEGRLYAAAVTDCFSRRVVGWAMADHMRTELVVCALEMAVARRRPGEGLVHHSDHGTQYTSLAFGRRCREAGIAKSMGSVGDCFDNALAESVWATLTKELLARQRFATRAQARTAIFDYLEAFYNPVRRHSSLGNVSPAEFERRAAQRPARPVPA
ncbi:MAG: IS3 family transposase [Thermoleophilaceae bacterium]